MFFGPSDLLLFRTYAECQFIGVFSIKPCYNKREEHTFARVRLAA